MRVAIRMSLGLAVIVGLSACGSSSESPEPATSAPGSTPLSASAAAPNASAAAADHGGPTAAASAGTSEAGLGGALTPAALSPAAAGGSMTVTTKAVQITIEGVATAAQVGSRQARPGHEFVIVDVSLKNVIPLTAVDPNARNAQGVGGLGGFGNNRRPSTDPKDLQMVSTPYVIPFLPKIFWLMTDGRFADTVDMEAQAATAGALPAGGFTVANFEEVVRGKLVFQAPASARYRAFQSYDNTHGHALIPLTGTAPPAPPGIVGTARHNDVMQLAVTEAGFSQAGSPPAGLKYYVVGLRGISRSPKDVVDLQFGEFVFLQSEQGCIWQPDRETDGLSRPFGDVASFPPTSPNEGQVAFLISDATKRARLIVAPRTGGSIVLPTSGDFTPSWPAPQVTIEDGATLKVHVLPTPAPPATLPPPAAGREHLLLDVVVENLKPSQGIEFQGTMQLRLMTPDGGFIQPSSSLSSQLACRLGDTGVIPAGGSRRFAFVYDVPTGMPPKLQYRGFEKDEAVAEIKR